MAITSRTLLQASLERAALNAVIDQQDTWNQQQIRAIMASIPMPADTMDAAGLQTWMDDVSRLIDDGLDRLKKRFPQSIRTNKGRALDLANTGSERLVLSQLP